MKKILIFIFFLHSLSAILFATENGRFDLSLSSFDDFFKVTSKDSRFYQKNFSPNQGLIISLNKYGKLTSKKLPYKGQKFVISFFAKCQAITKGKRSKQGTIIAVLGKTYEGKLICTRKIIDLQGTSNWKKYKYAVDFPKNVKYICLEIKYSAEAGTAWIKNLSCKNEFKNYHNLIDGNSFEHDLGRDNWFIKQGGKDINNLALASSQLPVVDKILQVHGKKCIRFDSPGTIDSQIIAYKGEELIVAGWIKTKKVSKGLKQWGGASINVLGYDKKQKYVAQQNLATITGTVPWSLYMKKIKFTSEVKYIVCRVRLLPGCQGKAWFDDVLILSGTYPGTSVPFNHAKATVVVDAVNSEKKQIRPIWNGIVGLYPHWLTDVKYHKETLDKAQKIGFKWLRIRAIMHELIDVKEEDNKLVYKWDKFDRFFDAMLKRKLLLSVTIDTIPKALTRPGVKVGNYKKNIPTDFKKWTAVNEAMFRHLIKRYGKNTIEKWRFHVWNEPWQFSKKNDPYYKIYDGVVNAVKKIEKQYGINIKLGVASGAYPPFLDDILAHVKQSGNISAIDVIAFHFYAGGSHPIHRFTDRYKLIKNMAEHYGVKKDVEIWCQEYNASYSSSHPRNWQGIGVNDTSFAAAVVIDAIRQWLDCGLTKAMFFSIRDWPNFKMKFFLLGACGIMTKTAVPKASFHAFVFLNQLKNYFRVSLRSTNQPINGIAGISSDKKNIRIILNSIDSQCNKPPYTTRVLLNCKLPLNISAKWRITKFWQVDSEHGDISTEWKKQGKPKVDKKKIEIIKSKSDFARFEPSKLKVNIKNNILQTEIRMPSSSIIMFELQNKSKSKK